MTIKKISLFGLFVAVLTFGYSQTTYPVTWEIQKEVSVVGTTITNATSFGSGVASSLNVLYPKSMTSGSSDGFIQVTAGSINQVKQIGFAIIGDKSTGYNVIDYSISFAANGTYTFNTPSSTFSDNNTATTVFKIAREGKYIKLYKDGLVTTVNVPVSDNVFLVPRVILSRSGSIQGSFSNVVTSFNTPRLNVTPNIYGLTNTLVPSNGTSPYKYSWDNGETSANISLMDKGPRAVEIKDANNLTCNRNFINADQVRWGTFTNTASENFQTIEYPTSPPGPIYSIYSLIGAPSSGFATAKSTTSFFIDNTVSCELIANQIAEAQFSASSYGFGFVKQGVTLTSSTNVYAGFFLINNRAVQIIFNGAVVKTIDMYQNDALNLTLDGNVLYWTLNGNEVHSTPATGLSQYFNIGGLTNRSVYKLTNLQVYQPVNNRLSRNYDVNTERGSITVNLTGITGYTTPFKYQVSTLPIPSLRTQYRYLVDSLGMTLDSNVFYAGNTSNTSYTFSNLKPNQYFVNVFDNTKKLVYSGQIYLNAGLTTTANSNMSIINSTIKSNAANSYAVIDQQVDEGEYSQFNIVRNNYVGVNYVGLVQSDYSSAVGSVKYGFYFNGRQMQLINNGVVQTGTTYYLNDNDVLSIRFKESNLILAVNGAELLTTSTVKHKKQYQIGAYFGSANNAMDFILKGFQKFKKSLVFSNVVASTCGLSNGSFTFTPSTFQLTGSNITMSRTDDLGVVTNTSYTNLSGPIVINGLKPGKYIISGTIDGIAFNADIYIGLNSTWEQTGVSVPGGGYLGLQNLVSFDQSKVTISKNSIESLTVGAVPLNGVGRSTLDIENQTGWLLSKPLLPTINYKNHLSFLAPAYNYTILNSMVDGTFRFERKFVKVPLFPMNKFYTGTITPGFTYELRNSIIGIQTGGVQVENYFDENTTFLFEKNATAIKVYQYSPSTGIKTHINDFKTVIGFDYLKATVRGLNNGFNNVRYYFGCPVLDFSRQYYELKDELETSNYATITNDNELRIKFEENYFDYTGKLNYKIVSLSDGLTYTSTNIVKSAHTNYIKINLSSTGLNLPIGKFYLLTVEDINGNKKYLKFKN